MRRPQRPIPQSEREVPFASFHDRRCRGSGDGRAGRGAGRAGGRGAVAGRPASGDGARDVRRRLLLVHGAALREAAGCRLGDLRLHRRPGEEPHLRAGLEPCHRPRGGGRDRVRPEGGQLSAAARGLLAQRRSHYRRPPVLRHRPPVPHGHLRPRRRAAAPGRGIQAGDRAHEDVPGPGADAESRPRAPSTSAEDYHQDFYKKSPVRYYSYRAGCGRDRRLKELWGDAAGH